MKNTIYVLSIILLGAMLLTGFYDLSYFVSLLSSFFFPICFIFFFRKIDVFERDSYRDLFFSFLLSTVTMFTLGSLVIYFLSIFRPEDINNFLQMFLYVGLPEEILKILPVLFILKYTKFINEPIDYIIYSSISALGFVFCENIGYISGRLTDSSSIVSIRNIEPLLMHMCTTSIFGFLIFCYRLTSKKKYILFGLLIAAAIHATYNQLCDVTIYLITAEIILLFFLVTFYAKLIQSLLNISPFFDQKRVPDINGAGKFLFLIVFLIILVNALTAYFFTEAKSPELFLTGIYWFIIGVILFSRIWVNLKIKKGKFIVFERKKAGETGMKSESDYKIVSDIKEAIGKYYESKKIIYNKDDEQYESS